MHGRRRQESPPAGLCTGTTAPIYVYAISEILVCSCASDNNNNNNNKGCHNKTKGVRPVASQCTDLTSDLICALCTVALQSYPAVTDFLRSGLFRWAGDASSFRGDTYIELVCSPNNPDGAIREAVLSSAGSGVAVHDLAYYWPQYTAITKRADHDVMLFTVSKSTGHAGTRIGWVIKSDPSSRAAGLRST